MFREFEDRIIHLVVTDTPQGGTHERDTFQKNAVTRGLADCTDDDVIIFSDLDEIPNPDEIRRILDEGIDPTKVYHFAQRLFYGYLNMEEVSGKLAAGEDPATACLALPKRMRVRFSLTVPVNTLKSGKTLS